MPHASAQPSAACSPWITLLLILSGLATGSDQRSATCLDSWLLRVQPGPCPFRRRSCRGPLSGQRHQPPPRPPRMPFGSGVCATRSERTLLWLYAPWKRNVRPGVERGRGDRTNRFPPLRFFGPSLGIGSALVILAGGGAARRSMCFSILSRRS